jgi:hypothetical protein
MKKISYLAILLVVSVVTVSVNAQVRIGGTADPNPGAILDLNESDNYAISDFATLALALPRTRLSGLEGTNARLNGGNTNPLNGMLVYNTNTTLGVGIYYYAGGIPGESTPTGKWIKLIGSDKLNVSSPASAVGETGSKTLTSGGTFKVLSIPAGGGAPVERTMTMPALLAIGTTATTAMAGNTTL